MTTPAYFQGSQKRMTVTFTDVNGTAVDPTEIVLTIREPDGALVSKSLGAAELTKSGTGIYYYDHTIAAKPGRHVVHWQGTAGTFATFEHEFYARRKEAQ